MLHDNMNQALFYMFYNLTSYGSPFIGIVYFIADIFPYIVGASALVYLFIHYKFYALPVTFKNFFNKVKAVFPVVLPVVVAWFAGYVLKEIIRSSRPFVRFTDVHSLFIETGYAFPSGHATFFAALATALYFVNKKVGYLFGFFALLIGLARVIAGVHFPLDILGGFALGMLTVTLLNSYFVRRKR